CTPLQDLLRQPWTPLYDYERFSATVRMFRSLGIRYVFLHPGDYNVTQLHNGELSRTVEGLRGSRQVLREQRLLGVYAFALEPWPGDAAATATLAPIGPQDFTLSVSHEPERASFL